MISRCAWCEAAYPNRIETEGPVTHGICDKHTQAMLEQLNRPDLLRKYVARSGAQSNNN